jgi:hypothetical protein
VYWDLIPQDAKRIDPVSIRYIKDPDWYYVAFQMLRYSDSRSLDGGDSSLAGRWPWVHRTLRRFLVNEERILHRRVYRDMLAYYRKGKEE